MANPWEFLSKWAKENVQPVAAYEEDNRGLSSHLAESCLRDAKRAGFKEDAIIKAANGDLQGFFASELDTAANAEVQRQVDKDKY